MRLPHNALFEVSKRIELSHTQPHFDQVLEILNGDRDELTITSAEDVVKLAYTYFSAKLTIDSDSVANELLAVVMDNGDMTVFESLSCETLCSGVICAQNKNIDHRKLQKAIAKYLQDSNRTEQHRRTIRSLANSTRPSTGAAPAKLQHVRENLVQRDMKQQLKVFTQSNSMKESKKIPSTHDYEKRKSSGEQIVENPPKKNRGSRQSASSSDSSNTIKSTKFNSSEVKDYSLNKQQHNDNMEEVKESEEESRRDVMTRFERKKWDQMALLAMNGDSNENWRERYRPRKLDARQVKEQVQQSIDPSPVKSKIVHDLPVLFEYTKKGQSFDFSQLKLPVLLNIQPENIDIHMDRKEITILKSGKGFSRPTGYVFTPNGFYAEGLTLLLGGVSNIEDGGTVIEQAKLEDITDGCSWIIIQNLVIYSKE